MADKRVRTNINIGRRRRVLCVDDNALAMHLLPLEPRVGGGNGDRWCADTLGEPEHNGWETPVKLGAPSARIEVFSDDPDAFIARAVKAGANSSLYPIRDHPMPWGTHRQGSFVDPFGHSVDGWRPLSAEPPSTIGYQVLAEPPRHP